MPFAVEQVALVRRLHHDHHIPFFPPRVYVRIRLGDLFQGVFFAFAVGRL